MVYEFIGSYNLYGATNLILGVLDMTVRIIIGAVCRGG